MAYYHEYRYVRKDVVYGNSSDDSDVDQPGSRQITQRGDANDPGWTMAGGQWRKNMNNEQKAIASNAVSIWKNQASKGSSETSRPGYDDAKAVSVRRGDETSRRSGGNKISVAVMFSDKSRKYKGRFDPEDTIYDLIVEIRRETGKNVQRIEDSNTKKTLHETVRLGILHETDLLRSMKAVVG